jgi:O-antigen/teichoic acid export membrane protein
LNLFIYIFSTGINKSLPLLFIPILTLYLSPEDYGIVSLYVVAYNLLIPILSIGFPNYFFRWTFENKKMLTDDVHNLLSIVFRWCLFVGILIAGSCIVSYWYLGGEFIIAVFCLYLAAVLAVLYQTYMQCLLSKSNSLNYAVVEITFTIILFSSTILCLVFLELGWISRIIGLLSANLAFSYWSWRYIFKKFLINNGSEEKSSLEVKINRERDFLSFGLGLIPHVIISTLITASDRLIISTFMTLSDVGEFAIALQYSSILSILGIAISKEWSRAYYSDPFDLGNRTKATIYSLLLIAVAIILYLFTDLFFEYFVGENFKNASVYVELLILSQLFHCLYMIFSVHLGYSKKTKILSKISMGSLMLNAVISLISIHYFGIFGVLYGTVFAMLFKLIVATWLSFKVKKLDVLRKLNES